MPESIYWYDFETTGTDPVLDRPLQFAGVRTDPDLNETAAPQNIYCRPGNDCLPTPEAMLVTGLRMSGLAEQGMNECDFAASVLKEFSLPKTCVVGFNSIRFDDEFTRQMLYRNFHDPYAREWRSGNSRWDVIDLFRAAHALRPDGFNWPARADGTPGFKLEELARANGLDHADAHDALADVRATIEIVRRLRAAQPRLYDFMFMLREKQFVLKQLYPLGKSPVIYVSGTIPAARGCTTLVLPICQHPTVGNGIIAFDLARPVEQLIQASPENLQRLVFASSGELEPGEERVALMVIHVNRSPFVAPVKTLEGGGAERLGLDLEEAAMRAKNLMNAPGLVEKVQEVYSMKQFSTQDDPDFQLYQGGFFSKADLAVMDDIRRSPPEQIGHFADAFQDERLPEMLFRYRGRNYPELLDAEELQRWQEYRLARFSGGAKLNELRQRTAALSEEGDDRARDLLADLSRYYNELAVG